jgi:hypothetical protein
VASERTPEKSNTIAPMFSSAIHDRTGFPSGRRRRIHPVTCLGLTFENDAAWRAYFKERETAREAADPAFRAIEGFPIGDDEAILVLSDLPYHAAYPNPFLSEIMTGWKMKRRASSCCTKGVAPV